MAYVKTLDELVKIWLSEEMDILDGTYCDSERKVIIKKENGTAVLVDTLLILKEKMEAIINERKNNENN